MNIKYYYYISKAKVDMLGAQLPEWNLPDFNPKIDVAGFSIGADFKSQDRDSLVKKTSNLIAKMKKKKLIQPLSDSSEIKNSMFYEDNSIWHSGLVSFNDAEVSYLLWKYLGGYLFLLAGSPAYIIGEQLFKEVSTDDKWHYSISRTHQIWDEIFHFVSDSFTSNISGLGFNESTCWSIDKKSLNNQGREKMLFLDYQSVNRESEIARIIHSTPELNPLSLGILCVQYLSGFPQIKIDTVFTVFRQINFSRREDLPVWVKALEKVQPDKERWELERCQGIIIGSPIYTALA